MDIENCLDSNYKMLKDKLVNYIKNDIDIEIDSNNDNEIVNLEEGVLDYGLMKVSDDANENMNNMIENDDGYNTDDYLESLISK